MHFLNPFRQSDLKRPPKVDGRRERPVVARYCLHSDSVCSTAHHFQGEYLDQHHAGLSHLVEREHCLCRKKDVILGCIISFSVCSAGGLGSPRRCNCESAAFSSALITFLNASRICTRSPITEMSSLHSSSENFIKVDPVT